MDNRNQEGNEIVKHLAKWGKDPGPGRWFVDNDKDSPKLSTKLVNQIEKDAEKISKVLKSSIKPGLFKQSKSLDQVFEKIFSRIDNELQNDPEKAWVKNNIRKDATIEEARLDFIKAYLFATQSKVIKNIFGNFENFANAPDEKKKPIKELLEKAEEYYNNQFNQKNPIELRQRSGARSGPSA